MTKDPSRILYIGADAVAVGIDNGLVGILLKGIEEQPGMNPDLGIALALTATEARGLAASLLRKAAEAEAGLSPNEGSRHQAWLLSARAYRHLISPRLLAGAHRLLLKRLCH